MPRLVPDPHAVVSTFSTKCGKMRRPVCALVQATVIDCDVDCNGASQLGMAAVA